MGLTISEGLREYQNKKRLESEEKILKFLLRNPEWSGWRDIWKRTRIYRNNIKPILKKLLEEKKIIKIDSVNTEIWYDDTNGHTHKKRLWKTIYLPNIANDHVMDIVKRELPEFLNAIKQKRRKEAADLYFKHLQSKYGNISIKTFVLDREDFYMHHHIGEMGEWLEDTFYARSVGLSLLFIYNKLGFLPE